MNVKKTAKKIGALITGATMVGATILGATADLSDYPAPFVTNGIVDAMLVIGANAKTSDTLGAIDIAASLQAAATVPVSTGGSVVSTVFSGDYVEIGKSNDLLELEENIGNVREVVTADDLDMLQGGSITTDKGTTEYSQYLRFSIGATADLQSGEVIYGQDEDDQVGDFFKVNDSQFAFEYELSFAEGLESDIVSGALDDIEDKTIVFFGLPYSIVDTDYDGTQLVIEMLGGDVTDTLSDGETKVYTIDGVEYEVTTVFISTGTTEEAMFSVNGVFTDTLAEGATDLLENGVQIGVRQIMTNDREGIVSFFLGANKLTLTDSDVTDGAFYASSSAVEVAEEGINDAQLKIVGANTSSSSFEITDIKYRAYANPLEGDIYVPPGHGIKEFLKEPEAMINPMWDIEYAGLQTVPTTEVKFNAKGDDEYTLDFTSNENIEYSMPLVSNKNGAFNLGSRDDDLFFREPAGLTNVSYFSGHAGDDDYILLTDDNDETGFTHILQWTDIDTDENQLTFEDLGSGEGSKTITYSGTGADDGDNITGYYTAELNVGGSTFNIYLYNVSGSWYIIPDHDGDGSINLGEKADVVTKGGLVIDLGVTNAPSDSWDVLLTTLGSEYDENIANQTVTVNITSRASNEVGMSVVSGVTLWDLEDNDELSQGMDLYGSFYEFNNPSDSNQAEELTIDFPNVQRGAQVVVTAGTVTSTQTGGSGGSVVVNPVAVGIAVLDNEVTLGSDNLIVVGGPCVNNIAAELLGNPADCAAGFEPGKAIIELFDSQNALLVAGYSAQDTLGAAYVLADYEEYSLSGTTVEVVVADLDSLTVSRIE